MNLLIAFTAPGSLSDQMRVDALHPFPYRHGPMKVIFLPQRRELNVAGSCRVADLLRKLNLLPGTVLVTRNDELLTSEDTVTEDDTVEIRNVISGG